MIIASTGQLDTAIERHPRPRIESLSDLIFGLSLSIASIGLIASPPASPGEVVGHVLAFGFIFLNLITAWMIYTAQMSVLPIETKSTLFINVLLLFLVALVPYLLNSTEVINPGLTPTQASSIGDFSSSLFGLDLAGILFILSGFAHLISSEEKRLVAREEAAQFKTGRNVMALLGVIELLSILPQFWQWAIFGIPSRLYVWYVPIGFYWLQRALRRESKF